MSEVPDKRESNNGGECKLPYSKPSAEVGSASARDHNRVKAYAAWFSEKRAQRDVHKADEDWYHYIHHAAVSRRCSDHTGADLLASSACTCLSKHSIGNERICI